MIGHIDDDTKRGGGRAMNDADRESKARDRQIAENESERQIVSNVRISGWAIAAAVVIGLAAVGWVLLHNHAG
jgi:hypothetical protein